MASHDDYLNTEPPPPAYELTNAELDRKIADAAQRSLTLQAEQLRRPVLPPLDEDGFPTWSEEWFNYNQELRQREVEAASAKLQSEYARVPASGSSGSASASGPPPRSHVQALPAQLPAKQKEGRFGWLDQSAQAMIAQDEDEDDHQGGLNLGRPPYSPPPPTQNSAHSRPGIQVQTGPRPHDVLAQPQSPVSDVDEDLPLPSAVPVDPLSRAPTYYPMGQAHPGPGLRRNDTRGSMDSTRGDLPAWTAEAPSLEGPAYEEIEGGRAPTPARRSTDSGERRPRPVQVQARPHIQERVAGGRRSMTGAGTSVPYASSSAPPPPPMPSVVAPPPPVVAPQPVSAPASVPASRRTSGVIPLAQSWTSPNTSSPATPYNPSVGVGVARPAAGSFDPGIAYRSTQRYTLVNAVEPMSPGGMLEAQNELRQGGASAFYNAAVAATMKTSATAFKAPPPPPPRMMSVPEDDASSVFSGMSGGRQGSVHSGGGGARMSVYSGDGGNRMSFVPPAGGNGFQGFQHTGQQAYQAAGQGFQPPGQGYQPPGQGYQPGGQGYQPTGGMANPNRMSTLPPSAPGAQYQPAGQEQQPPTGQGYQPGGQGYQPTGGMANPNRMSTLPSPTPGAQYQPGGQGHQSPTGQGYQPGGQGYQPGGQGYQPTGGAANPNRMSTLPPPPPGAQPAYIPTNQPAYAPGGQPAYVPGGQPAYQPGGGDASRPLPAAPGGFQPAPNAGGFVAPPPPPAAAPAPAPVGPGGFVQPGRKPAKLYKRL